MTTPREPLPGAHADEVREIASREVTRFARLLADSIAAVPVRDGFFDAGQLWAAVGGCAARYESGEIA